MSHKIFEVNQRRVRGSSPRCPSVSKLQSLKFLVYYETVLFTNNCSSQKPFMQEMFARVTGVEARIMRKQCSDEHFLVSSFPRYNPIKHLTPCCLDASYLRVVHDLVQMAK